jgi:chromosome partitioning protein
MVYNLFMMKDIQVRAKRYLLSVVNHKGGVGKTTTAVNLAACLGERGYSALVIDLDPQGSASLALGFEDNGERLFQALQKTIPLPIEATMISGVDLVPAGPLLIGAWQRFAGALGKEILWQCLRYTDGSWDWIIVDCPPSMGVLTVAALHASNGVLIPVEATRLSVAGLHQMTATIDEIAREHRDRHLKLQAIIPCRTHIRRRIHGDIMLQLENAYPGLIGPLVRENAALAEAPAYGRPIITFASYSNGASDYRAVAEWIDNHVR